MMIRTRSPATCVGRDPLAAKMEQMTCLSLRSKCRAHVSLRQCPRRGPLAMRAVRGWGLPHCLPPRRNPSVAPGAVRVARPFFWRLPRGLLRQCPRRSPVAMRAVGGWVVSSAWPCARLTARAVEPLATARASVSPSIAITSHIIAVIIVPPSYLGRKVWWLSCFHFGSSCAWAGAHSNHPPILLRQPQHCSRPRGADRRSSACPTTTRASPRTQCTRTRLGARTRPQQQQTVCRATTPRADGATPTHRR